MVLEATSEETMIRDAIRQLAKKYDREYWLAKARAGAFADELWQELG